jgi:hypothetical protein
MVIDHRILFSGETMSRRLLPLSAIRRSPGSGPAGTEDEVVEGSVVEEPAVGGTTPVEVEDSAEVGEGSVVEEPAVGRTTPVEVEDSAEVGEVVGLEGAGVAPAQEDKAQAIARRTNRHANPFMP